MILENSHGRDARMVPELRTLVVRFNHMATLAITPRSMGVGYARSPGRRNVCDRSRLSESNTTSILLTESVLELTPWQGSVC